MRRTPTTRRLLRTAAAATVLLATAACDDGPTGPASYAHVAGGETWVAVAEPAGLPGVATWAPYLAPGSPAAARVRALREEAGRARSAGRVEDARALENEAFLLTARSLEAAPPAQALLASLAALDAWALRADGRLALHRHAGLEAAAVEVRLHAAGARAALVRGDTAAAVVSLAEGALAAREYSPVAVGLRLLGAAEVRLDGGGASAESARRARRLLVGAREGLASGDTVRSLRRAIYALQILDAEPAAERRGGSETVDAPGVPR